MKRWNRSKGRFSENEEINAFVNEIVALCKKHGLSLGHEDTHGAFIVEKYR